MSDNQKQEVLIPSNYSKENANGILTLIRTWKDGNSYIILIVALFFNGVLGYAGTFFSSSGMFREFPLEILLGLIAFFSLFVFAGIFVFYFAVCSLVNRTIIQANMREIKVRFEPLPWLGAKNIQRSDIKQIYVKRKRNSKTINYNVLFTQSQTEKEKKIVSSLTTPEEAFYIEQELKDFYRIKEEYQVEGQLNLREFQEERAEIREIMEAFKKQPKKKE